MCVALGAHATARSPHTRSAWLAEVAPAPRRCVDQEFGVAGPELRVFGDRQRSADRVGVRRRSEPRTSPSSSSSACRAGSFPDVPLGAIRDRDAITILESALNSVLAQLRAALKASGEDPVSQDLLTGFVGELEKQAWLLRTHR